MVRVTVEVFLDLRHKLGWSRRVVELDCGGRVCRLRDVFDAIPELKEIVVKGGSIAEGFMVLVNGRHAVLIGGLDAPVKDGDTVVIFPPAGGG